jgi:predicted TIM-barrel fold metal-dependent hydrolase
MVIDAHVHTLGHESADAIRKAMDRAGIQRICLLSPPFLGTGDEQRRALHWMRDLTARDPQRLLGYFWLNPLLPEAHDLVREARDTEGIRAFKLMSDHWYPHDEPVRATLSVIEGTGLPVLFHAGILWSHMDSSRFCRPVDFEVMLHHPGIRFCLAHLAWPWVDECLAVQARMNDGMKQMGRDNTMYVDLSPGTPLPVREEALQKVMLIGDPDRTLWGSDDAEADKLEKASRMLAFDRDCLGNTLEVKDGVLAGIFGRNHLRFLGLDA